MEGNEIDNIIKQKLESRELKPSPSAWERLENSLEESKVKSKKLLLYKSLTVAASISLIIGVFLNININEVEELKNEVIVLEEVQKDILSKETNNFKDTSLDQEIFEKKEIVSIDTKENKYATKKIEARIKEKPVLETKKVVYESTPEIIANNKTIEKTPTESKIKEKRIHVNSEDLLYAVTHTPEEVKKYYAKLELTRGDVLDSIKKQLKLSNVKVNPETILAEVESLIEDEEIQGSFKEN